MTAAIQNFLHQITQPFNLLGKIPKSLHSRLERSIDQGNDSDNVKVKKKMLLFYVYTTVVYSLCLPFFNPYASLADAAREVAFAFCQLLMIKVKNYYFLVTYFVIYTFLSIYLPVSKDEELLKGIGVALMHHNLFFLFPDNVLLKLFYIFLSQWLMRGTETRVLALLHGQETDMMQAMIKSFYCSWPLIYVVNHISSMYLVRAFQKAMRQNKKIENKLKEINKELVEANQKLASAFTLVDKTNQDLKDALKARELFIASASHELRNPLNSMIGNIELVRLDTKDPKLLKMLETCKVCGEVLLALINNILDVAKINAEKLELHYVPGDFMEVIERVWNISSFKIKEKGLKGELFFSNTFPKSIEMDSHRLTQILLNLIGNSAKFTCKGFIKVIVSWHGNPDDTIDSLNFPHEDYLKMLQKTLTVLSPTKKKFLSDLEDLDSVGQERVTLEGDRSVNLFLESNYRTLYPKFMAHMLASNFSHLTTNDAKLPRGKSMRRDTPHPKRQGIIKIQIIDTGCGISTAALKHLFQPFCQADSSITQRFGGTGLGLYITQQLVNKMGGKISVYSQENVGSNFCILLPAIMTNEDEFSLKISKKCQSEANLVREVQSYDLKALVVDDDPFNRSIFVDFLKKLHIQADVAINGQEALNMFMGKGEGYYSFITIDLEMPVMDGFTACREIRKYEAKRRVSKSIPIVIITGNCTDVERTMCLDPSGGIRAIEFYRKPFTFRDCQGCVQTVLKREILPSAKKRRVLVVDDDPFNTSFLQQYLLKNNFQCETCSNGKEAVEMVFGGGYNAVLMDCEMPEMDGYTASRLIKQRYPQLLVVGITGHSGEDFKMKAKAHGMNQLETKPVKFERVISILEKEILL